MRSQAHCSTGLLCLLYAASAGAQMSPDAVQAELAELRRTVTALQAEVAALKADRAGPATASSTPSATTADAAPSAAPLATIPPAGATGGSGNKSPLSARQSVSDNPTGVSRIDNQAPPTDPELRGFLAVPGTQTLLRIGGYAKLDAIYDTRDAGNRDQFISASLQPPQRRGGGNFNLHARQTRLSAEIRRPTAFGHNLRFYLETDFFGGGDGAHEFHLRQAFGQLGSSYAGYGYSAFMDADALPDTLDFAGPGGQVFLLQPSIHHALRLNDSSSLTLSAERPLTEVGSVYSGHGTPSGSQRWPDLVLALRGEHDWGHLQLGGLLRQLGYRDDARQDSTLGAGISLSGTLDASQRSHNNDLLMFGAAWGEGIARYLSDTSGSGLDAAVDADGRLHALRGYGAYAGYTHYWNPAWRSNLVYGQARLRTTPWLADAAFGASSYAAANLVWSPLPTLTMGIELIHGRLRQQDGQRADNTRIQGSLQYSFVK